MIVFLEAILHSTNTFFAVSRPVFTDETDTYVNKVAPTARIYLHLICRKRHLPLKLRKGKTKRVRCKTQQRTNVVRGTHGFARSLDTVLPQKPYRYDVNAPLKK